jgi:hypothetical protein
MLAFISMAMVLAAVLVAGAAQPQTPALGTKPQSTAFRPPSVPLVTFNPYLSVWSAADRLTDDNTRHWTRREHPLVSMVCIDGKAYCLMGKTPKDLEVPAFPQTSVTVLPTRTIYDFDNGHIHVTMTFMTAGLPDDLEALSRPLSYITWQVRAVDGATHEVQVYSSTSALLAVSRPEEKVAWGREKAGPLTVLRAGTELQPVLGTMGDDTRIDWGYVYAAAPTADVSSDGIEMAADMVSAVLAHKIPRTAGPDQKLLAFIFDLGKVATEPVSRHVIVAYDEVYAIKYFGQKLRPYWRRDGATAGEMLQAAERDYPRLAKRCAAFDEELMADLTKAGGPRYAQIAALAYRQCLAAMGLAADAAGQPLFFTKENTSNGDIATVDVIYPMAPMLLLVSPSLMKASLVSVLDYSASPRWKFPNAPHDLGTYPVVMGRDDGGEGMPVEESGNMLILCDALAQIEGNPSFVDKWWPQLTQWAQYLEKYGLDPENQLCTDDFMGHLAHNANLSVKAILALAAYGDLCRMRGDAAAADRYARLAKEDAEHWMKVAAEGDHYRLAFDKKDTWSQKYNLVWDKLLGLNVFPPAVAEREVAYYKKVIQRYGVPLDSRTRLTKTDWSLWSATLAGNQADFEALVSPIYDYLNETTARDPLADSYTTDNVKSGGMHARPVVGGLFIKMLADRAVWKKWAARDRAKVGPWAPLPAKPVTIAVIPTSQHSPVVWRYTESRPPADWMKPGFDASAWKEGPGGFGTKGTPNAVVGTVWRTDDIWLRRECTMPAGEHPGLQLLVYHDEDVEIYLNGVLAASAPGFVNSYEPMELSGAARALLKPGAKIVLAVHCHQTTGGQGVDVGLADVK